MEFSYKEISVVLISIKYQRVKELFGFYNGYKIQATASYTPPKRYAYTPQLIHIHPPPNRLRSYLFRLERHVCLTCMHLHRENQTFKMQLLCLHHLNQVLISIIVQVVEFKLKLEYTKGPFSKVLLKGQSPMTSVSLLNITANTW